MVLVAMAPSMVVLVTTPSMVVKVMTQLTIAKLDKAYGTRSFVAINDATAGFSATT
ncbi:bluetail domain-containing putative surface protein, partial [Dolichospermum circinale]|uniref:bluetail domain-containing putative surface protein n=1 Tax=Dolichospermum circinale TaxID=109265 RepID=UPI0039C74CAC